MKHILKLCPALLLLVASSAAFSADKTSAPPPGQGVQITQLDDRLRIEINGQLFTEYFFKDVPRPYCYPLLGPGGAAMTRDFPMKDSPNESHDHKHHRSLWFAHGAINGHDFWSEDKDFGKTIHEGFDEVKSGHSMGIIKSHNKWVAADGTVICTDERTLRIYNTARVGLAIGKEPASRKPMLKRLHSPKGLEQELSAAKIGPATTVISARNERVFDFEITLKASNGEL